MTATHKNIVITGGGGQLGWELQRTAPAGYHVQALSRVQLDIGDEKAVDAYFADNAVDVVINAAAYTAVDKAEAEEGLATSINADAPGHLVRACAKNGAYLVHVSTDFVFNGEHCHAYKPGDPTDPLGVYGASKLAGEQAVQSSGLQDYAIVRTAWVYSSHGQNFVKTMLRLMGDKPQLGVVVDQIGTPTWARGLAEACWGLVPQRVHGLFHWTDAGVASWYDFAVAIQALGIQHGLLDKAIPIRPIPASAYPTPAKRPAFSVLDKTAICDVLPQIEVRHWQAQLDTMLSEYKSLME